MKHLLIVLGSIAFLSSCKKQQNYCGVSDPVHDIAWLHTYTTTNDSIDVYSITYNGTDGFLLNDRNTPCCDQFTGYFKDCSGNTICTWGGIAGGSSCPNFDQTATNKQLIFSN